MNERILEIELKAAYDTINPNRPSTPAEVDQFNKKFSEMIIKECAGVCEDSNYEFGKIFAKMIKEHFGVEE